jgi:hypothetical protein
MLNATTPPRDPDADLRKPAAESRKPKTGKPSTAQKIKSFVRKNLLASPEFPRLYADVVISSAPNSPEAKILARNYKKIVDRVNARITNARIHNERTNTNMATCKSCTHIKVTGVPCGSPALRGEEFCYFHQRMLRGIKVASSRVSYAALLEDEESIQASLMEIVNALLRGTIELKRAELILRALNTAVRNIRRAKFGQDTNKMVREVPTVPDPGFEDADRAEAALQAERAEIARVIAAHQRPTNASPAQAATAHVATDAFVRPAATPAHVGTAAPGCPGGPEVPGRSAVPPKPASTPPAAVTNRKPPATVKSPEAPKERKTAAHRASRGK